MKVVVEGIERSGRESVEGVGRESVEGERLERKQKVRSFLVFGKRENGRHVIDKRPNFKI